MKRFWLVLVCLSLPALASAQTTTTILTPGVASQVGFVPSPEHLATQLDGTPLVTSYQFDVTTMNALGVIVFTTNLGKPNSPDSTGKVWATVPALASAIAPDVLHQGRVSVVGPILDPTGVGVSLPSNPFGVVGSTQTPPGAASNVTVRKAI